MGRAEIELHHTESCWIAEFSGPIGKEMTALTAVDICPTEFSGHLPALVVRSAVALLDPPSPAEDSERRSALERAVGICKELGLMIACSYLKDRGWSTDAAYEALSRSAES